MKIRNFVVLLLAQTVLANQIVKSTDDSKEDPDDPETKADLLAIRNISKSKPSSESDLSAA